jgi:catechol 2,3-dioxygenase-like lactoylglutathione lyase family enzyme
MSPATPAATRFHLSLNVSDLGRSVDFFTLVFGAPPAKRRADYAKFEPEFPPLVLSLEPHSHAGGGALNHAGFRFPDSAALVAAQRRLEEGGIRTQREEGVECCYARQTKFWARDPDANLWEFYVLEGDIDHRGAGQALEVIPSVPAAAPSTMPAAWEHRMGQPFQIPDEFGDGSLDEILLRGTFNVPVSGDEMVEMLQQSHAALKPDGAIVVHVLTAETPLTTPPHLPGAAAYVRHVPVREEVLNAVKAAGFVDVQLTTFRSKACFEHDGVALRETKIGARRPAAESDATCTVVFKGPFAEATDDAGHTWYRGQKTTVPLSRWQGLQRTPLADLFVRLPAETVVGACGVKQP